MAVAAAKRWRRPCPERDACDYDQKVCQVLLKGSRTFHNLINKLLLDLSRRVRYLSAIELYLR